MTTTRTLGLAELTDLDARHVMGTYTRAPVAFTRGSGCRLWDTEGREVLDFLSGLAVTSLGHAHPAVADAIAAQARRLLHVSNLYLNDRQPVLAARLDARCAAATGTSGRVFFANSGAEANECAIKLARRFGQTRGGPARFGIVTALGSFHGRTLATLAATGQPTKHEPFRPLPPGFHHVPYGDLDALDAVLDGTVAAVMLEAVQGEGGVRPAPPGYLPAVRDLCDRRGALLILDEVQTGLGRTGRWFAFEHFGDVRPDVVTLAKALGNGMPIGACWARAEVAALLGPGTHATTFGGQPLACAAALAVLEVMEAEDVCARAVAAGARLRARLEALEGVRGVRGLGLLLAAELDGGDAATVVGRALEAGLLVNAVTPSALRLAPPLLVTDEEIDEACGRLAAALAGPEGEAAG